MNRPSDLVLSQVEIQGFRSLRQVGPVEVGADLVVLVGPNEAGKTAFLDAIAWLLGEYGFDMADRCHRLEDDEEACVVGWFVSTDGGSRILRRRRSKDGMEVLEEESAIHPGLAANPRTMKIQDLREAIRRNSIPGPGGTRRQPLADAVLAWLEQQDGSAFSKTWSRVSGTTAGVLPKVMRFGAATGSDPNSEIRTAVVAAIRDRLATADYEKQVLHLRQRLESDIGETHSAIREKISDRFPDLDAVHVDISFDFTRPSVEVVLTFERDGDRVTFDKIGEGRKRRVSLVLYETELERLSAGDDVGGQVILMYDEPDTHLDLAAQSELFDVLIAQAALERTKILVATHSMSFLDKVDLGSVVRFSLSDRYETGVEVLGGEQDLDFVGRVALSLGIRTSTLLDRGCLLVVEGHTEEAAIPDLYRTVMGQSPLTHGVTILNTQGSGALESFVKVLSLQWGRSVVVLADGDAADLVEKWSGKVGLERDRLFHIGEKEFEDAFDPTIWCKVLQESFSIEDREWEVGEIADALVDDKPSRSLRSLVASVTGKGVTKPDLGLALAKTAALEEVPDVLVRCFQEAKRLAGGS